MYSYTETSSYVKTDTVYKCIRVHISVCQTVLFLYFLITWPRNEVFF